MKRVNILPTACLLLISLSSANAVAAGVCAPPVDYALLADASGIGGTGHGNAADSGIGGTGHGISADSGIGGTGHGITADSGIGGTGHGISADSGIGGIGHGVIADSGIGGTGRAVPSDSGIGGTGHTASVDSGIGGTGHVPAEGGIGGTGIVGTITGFASICVNGLEVHYDAAVPVTDNGQPAHTRGLAIGQVVAVEAGPSPRGLEARRIAVLHALVGPVTRSLGQDGRLEVMGAKVSLDQPQLQDHARALKAGDWVKVSGHPAADHGVVASRVTRIDAGGEASASGRADPEGRRVGAVAVDRAASGQLTVRGTWDGQRLQVRDSRPADGTVWAGRPTRVVIETRVRHRDGETIRTGRADVDAVLAERRGRDAEALSEGTLLRVTARFDADGKLRPLRIERAQRQDELHSRSGSTSGKEDDKEPGDAAGEGKDDSRGRSDEDRGAKETSKALEKQQKEIERSQRNERDAAERDANRDRTERNEKVDRLERPERSEKVDRIERPERTEKVERIERPERTEKVERIERPERTEKVERTERSGVDH